MSRSTEERLNEAEERLSEAQDTLRWHHEETKELEEAVAKAQADYDRLWTQFEQEQAADPACFACGHNRSQHRGEGCREIVREFKKHITYCGCPEFAPRKRVKPSMCFENYEK